MNKTLRVANVRFVILMALLLSVVTVLPAMATSNKWRASLDGRARVAGEIELSVAAERGVPTSVVVAIPEGTSENHAAARLRDAVRATFGDVYHVETDDGEDVLIKAHGRTPDFDLSVTRNTAEGLRIKLSRE